MFDTSAAAICLVAKSWDYHVDVALGISNEENVEAIADSVKAVRQHDREPMIDCEHFFDGYKANPDYAVECAKAAFHEGARWIVLCDTNGGTLPDENRPRSSRKSQSTYPAAISAFTPITIRRTRSPTRLPPSAPARARSRAR